MRGTVARGFQKTLHDPARGFYSCNWPPELVQRKVTERFSQRAVEWLRPRVAPHGLCAIGIMFWSRQADEVGGGMFRLQCKPRRGAQFGPSRFELIPDAGCFVDAVGADPHFKLLHSAVKQSIGHNPMLAGTHPRRQRGLHGARHGRQIGGQWHARTAGGKCLQRGHPREILSSQTRNGEQ